MERLTTESIAVQIQQINDEIAALKDKIETLQLTRHQLQQKCTHPHGHSYIDRSGARCYTCPDCGYDR